MAAPSTSRLRIDAPDLDPQISRAESRTSVSSLASSASSSSDSRSTSLSPPNSTPDSPVSSTTTISPDASATSFATDKPSLIQPFATHPPPLRQPTSAAKSTSSTAAPTTPRGPALKHITGKRKSARKGISAYIQKRQLKVSFFLIALVIVSHLLIPSSRSFTSKCLFISYRTVKHDGSVSYGIGTDDAYFVSFWIVALTLLRALFVDNWLVTLAKRVYKIRSNKITARFAEQAYALITYSTFFLAGLQLLVNSPYMFSVTEIWKGWPNHQVSASMKAYYLIQLASWFQQIYVINIEERRKDHWQMFTHHIVTCALVSGSYYYYFTRVGHVILVLMDSVDIFLSLAKVLRYTGFQRACDATFVFFILTWIAMRHGLYNYILYSAYRDSWLIAEEGCHYNEDTGELIRCFDKPAYWMFVGLLGALQCITILWMYMILRVFVRVIRGSSAVDSRSDEDTDAELEDTEGKKDK